jgi:biotin carboxyl carrier protein
MRKRTLNLLKAAAVLLLAVPAIGAGPGPAVKKKAAVKQQAAVKQGQAKEPAAGEQGKAKEPAQAPAAAAAPVITHTLRDIKTGAIEVVTPVTGVTTAQETYDIYAPFDGRIEEVQTELFNFITPATTLARIISMEMAALLDSTPDGGRKQTERRWQDVYKFYDIKPETQGIVTNIYTSPKTTVYKGDRLFTVAKKVIMIGKNTAPLYSHLGQGMTAEIKHYRTDEQYQARLTNFIPLKDSQYFSRLWLEVLDLKNGIRIGEQFDGTLSVGSNPNTRLVPRKNLFLRDGKKYLLMEVETGLITEEEAEITVSPDRYLEIRTSDKETEDGNPKK